MRIVEKKERKQHAKCPYIELDKYEDYEEYFATIDGDLRQFSKIFLNLTKGYKDG